MSGYRKVDNIVSSIKLNNSHIALLCVYDYTNILIEVFIVQYVYYLHCTRFMYFILLILMITVIIYGHLI